MPDPRPRPDETAAKLAKVQERLVRVADLIVRASELAAKATAKTGPVVAPHPEELIRSLVVVVKAGPGKWRVELRELLGTPVSLGPYRTAPDAEAQARRLVAYLAAVVRLARRTPPPATGREAQRIAPDSQQHADLCGLVAGDAGQSRPPRRRTDLERLTMTGPRRFPPTADPPGRREGPKGLTVLVVDDHADTAASTAVLLRLQGHDARVALCGLAALELARELRPDVVLLDLGLPDVDGYEVARLLHHRPPHARRPLLVAVTGFGREADRRRSGEAGIDLHLVKPVDPDQLFAVLRRFRRLLADLSRD